MQTHRDTVARAQVGDFRNAMLGRADKGIIMTTGTFSPDAIREAERDGAPPVELVDGEQLVAMFVELELGLKPKTVYEVDHTFFTQFMPPLPDADNSKGKTGCFGADSNRRMNFRIASNIVRHDRLSQTPLDSALVRGGACRLQFRGPEWSIAQSSQQIC